MKQKVLLLGLVFLCLVCSTSVFATQNLNSTGGWNQTTTVNTGLVFSDSTTYSINSNTYTLVKTYTWSDGSYIVIDGDIAAQMFTTGGSYQTQAFYRITYNDGTTASSSTGSASITSGWRAVTFTVTPSVKPVQKIELYIRQSGNLNPVDTSVLRSMSFTYDESVEQIFFSPFDFKNITVTSDGCNVTVSDDFSTFYDFPINGTYEFSDYVNTFYVKLNDTTSCTWFLLQASNYAIYFKYLNLIDEATNEPFNLTPTNSTRATFTCQEIASYSFDITSTPQNISIPCNYDKITVSVSYDTEVYSRTILESFNTTDSPVYLVDLTTTQAIYNAFLVNDYIGEYNEPRLYIKKNIEGEQVVIHSDYLDVENKLSAFLIENDPYILELWSDNLPVNVLGFYGADIAGTKEITVTTANIDTNSPETVGNGVTIYTYAKNISADTYAYAIFNDTTSTTYEVDWYLYVLNETDQTLTEIYNVNSSGIYGELVFIGYNITNQTNNSIISALVYTKSGLEYTYYKQITFADLDMSSDNMFGYLSASVIQWSVIILLSVVALSGTMTTQNYANYGIIGLAALAKMFGLFPVSIILLILSLAISFMFQVKSSEDLKIPR